MCVYIYMSVCMYIKPFAWRGKEILGRKIIALNTCVITKIKNGGP